MHREVVALFIGFRKESDFTQRVNVTAMILGNKHGNAASKGLYGPSIISIDLFNISMLLSIDLTCVPMAPNILLSRSAGL